MGGPSACPSRPPVRSTSGPEDHRRRSLFAPPRYDQKRFERVDKAGRLRLVASHDGAEGSIALRQDVKLYASVLDAGASTSLSLPKGRHLWAQALRGTFEVNGHTLSAGDGLAASDETAFTFKAPNGETEFLVFDLA